MMGHVLSSYYNMVLETASSGNTENTQYSHPVNTADRMLSGRTKAYSKVCVLHSERWSPAVLIKAQN